MKNQNSTRRLPESRLSIRYIENSDVFVVRMGNISEVVSANFIRYQLGIPFTKKDGTHMTVENIDLARENARRAYINAIANKPMLRQEIVAD